MSHIEHHELRLVAYAYVEDFAAAAEAKPYCPCGWVGRVFGAGECDLVTAAYRQHLVKP